MMPSTPKRDLPVVDGRELCDPPESRTRVAGVLLAAGTSSRFGSANKLLAEIDGALVVRRAAQTLVDAGLDPVVAVVGHEAGRVRRALDGSALEVVRNDAYGAGQSTSLRTGLAAVDGRAEAVVVALGDMPFVDPRSVELLVDAYRAGVGTALAASYEGRRGNPVLFAAEQFDRLLGIDGDVGGRQILLAGEESALIETGDPGVVLDVDTREDLDAARDRDGAERR